MSMFLKIGHRGAAGHMPENTISSFAKAISLQVDMVEFDVYACASGELVVIHDSTVDRTTNGHGYVEQMSLAELQALDAGKGEHIPTLQETLNFLDRRVSVNIELKGENTAEKVAAQIAQCLRNGWHPEQFLVSSFNHHELSRFYLKMPEIRLGFLLSGIPLEYAGIIGKIPAYSINLDSDFVTQAFIDDAHKRGLQVLVWTVNTPDEVTRIKKLGVDGAFSNFPELL